MEATIWGPRVLRTQRRQEKATSHEGGLKKPQFEGLGSKV